MIRLALTGLSWQARQMPLMTVSKGTPRAVWVMIPAGLTGKIVDQIAPLLDEGDTIYLTTADASGMMVSLIQSNYRGMGSGMAPPGLGFILQDRGEQFVLREDHPNGYAPGKRPFHTIIPAFLTKDGQPVMSFGVMGASMQPQGHVQTLVRMLCHGQNPQAVQLAEQVIADQEAEITEMQQMLDKL